MEDDSEGGGWKLGMAFICTGIVFVLSCGVASVVYYTGNPSSCLRSPRSLVQNPKESVEKDTRNREVTKTADMCKKRVTESLV